MPSFPLSLPNSHSSLLRITFSKIKPVLEGMCNFSFLFLITKHSGLKSIFLKLWAEDTQNFVKQWVVNGNNIPSLLIQAVWKKNFLKSVLQFVSYCNNINTLGSKSWILFCQFFPHFFPLGFKLVKVFYNLPHSHKERILIFINKNCALKALLNTTITADKGSDKGLHLAGRKGQLSIHMVSMV